MRRAFALAVALTLAAGARAAAHTDPDQSCKFRHASESVSTLVKMPGPILKFVSARIGPMADRGQFFNATDVVSRPAPFNRFIRGGTIGERWFLWYEHGGIAYWKEIVLFGSDPSGTVHILAQSKAAGGSDLCGQTDALLDSAH